MSKPVRPEAIGGFVLGGLALLVLALLMFGGERIFRPKIQWVVYFDSSLNGLNVGAPVKVQGVQVGVVKAIELQMDEGLDRLMKPVIIEVDPGRVVDSSGSPLDIRRFNEEQRARDFSKLLNSGLRARLEVQSILTGLLYVDLDFRPDQPSRLTGLGFRGLQEIPSVPPTVDEVLATLEATVRKFGDLPIDRLVSEWVATLSELRQLLSSEETHRSQLALARALESAAVLMARLDRQLPPLITHLDGISQKLEQRLPPLLETARTSLGRAGDAADEVGELAGTDSELRASLREIHRAAAALRGLSETLERHPETLLFGREPQSDP